MLERVNSEIDWGLWLWWVMANLLGIILAFAISSVIALAAGIAFGGEAVDKVPDWPFIWLGLAAVQWLVVRQRIHRAGWWLLASLGGWAAGLALLGLVINATENLWGGTPSYETIALIFALATGASLGVAQWLVLRRHMAHAGWWVPASILGWVAAFVLIGKSLDQSTDFLVLALIPPAISGLALAWLVQQTQPGRPDMEATSI